MAPFSLRHAHLCAAVVGQTPGLEDIARPCRLRTLAGSALARLLCHRRDGYCSWDSKCLFLSGVYPLERRIAGRFRICRLDRPSLHELFLQLSLFPLLNMRGYFLIIGVGLLSLIAFNIWMDPAHRWYRLPSYPSEPWSIQDCWMAPANFNQRDFKRWRLSGILSPDVVVLGSSRAMLASQEELSSS